MTNNTANIGYIENFGDYWYVTGYSMYAKVFEHNRDREGYEGAYKEHDGMYTIMLGVPKGSPAEKEFFSWNKKYEPKTGGVQLPLDKGAVEGMQYFTFKRKHTFTSKKGEVIEKFGGPPRVLELVDPDKEVYKDFSPDNLIGNGSIVTLKLYKYQIDPRRSTVRLEAVSVDQLKVPLDENGEPMGKRTAQATYDDEIPF